MIKGEGGRDAQRDKGLPLDGEEADVGKWRFIKGEGETCDLCYDGLVCCDWAC